MKYVFQALLVVTVVLTGCGDPQQRALDDLTERGYTLSVAEFHRAAGKGDVPALEAFLQAGTRVDVPSAKGETALIHAVREGKSEAVALLMQKGASIDTKDAEGRSTLVIAARIGDVALIENLLNHESPPRFEEAVNVAVREGRTDALRVLIQAAGRNGESTDFSQALLLAAERGHVECLDLLLQTGVETDVRQRVTGLTPLHFAVRDNHIDAARLLLSNGASRLALTADAKSVWELGPLSPEMARLLAERPSPRPDQVSISGAVIVGGITLVDTHPGALPLRFLRVESGVAVIEDFAKEETLHVRPGESIGGTGLRLHAIREFVAGMPEWLLPHVVITDSENGVHSLLPQNAVGYALPLAASLEVVGAGVVYEARPGDRFSLAGRECKVRSVKSQRVVLEDAQGRELMVLRAKP